MLNIEHPSVQNVLNIAEEIANENKFLDTQIIYERAKRRLKLPKKGLLQIIQLLYANKYVVDGSKFTQHSILDNQLRKMIFQIIVYNPGIHFSALKRKIKTKKSGCTGQLIWHLDLLKKFNYIKKISYKNYVIFTSSDLNDEQGILHFLLRDKINKRILYLFIDRECFEKQWIYKSLNEARQKVYYHLKELENSGILTIKDDGWVYIAADFHHILETILNN